MSWLELVVVPAGSLCILVGASWGMREALKPLQRRGVDLEFLTFSLDVIMIFVAIIASALPIITRHPAAYLITAALAGTSSASLVWLLIQYPGTHGTERLEYNVLIIGGLLMGVWGLARGAVRLVEGHGDA